MDGNLAAVLVISVVALTAVAIYLRGDMVRAYFFEPLEQGRLAIGALVAILLVATWVRSGTPWKVLTALLLVAFVVAYIAYEQPHRDIK